MKMNKKNLFMSSVFALLLLFTAMGSSCSKGGKKLSDREVLVKIYDALNIKKNVPKEKFENWNTDRPIGEWEGVECNAEGRVTKLELSGDSLYGAIPAEIGQLTELEQLEIDLHCYEGVQNSCPAEVFQLNKLKELSISIPNSDDVAGSKIPEKIDLPVIEELDLVGFDGPIDGLCKLTTLTSLEIVDLNAVIPDAIGNLVNLTNLNISSSYDAKGSVPESIGKLKNLKQLTIDYSQFFGSVKGASGKIPASIWDLTNLERLFLRKAADAPSSIPADKVAMMTNLESIVICNSALTGQIPKELFASKKLCEVALYDNPELTGPIPDEICDCLDMSSINFNRNNLTGTIPAKIGNLKKLTRLWLEGNKQLTGTIPAGIGGLDKLLNFGLEDTQVSRNVPEAVKANKNFSSWHLWN